MSWGVSLFQAQPWRCTFAAARPAPGRTHPSCALCRHWSCSTACGEAQTSRCRSDSRKLFPAVFFVFKCFVLLILCFTMGYVLSTRYTSKRVFLCVGCLLFLVFHFALYILVDYLVDRFSYFLPALLLPLQGERGAVRVRLARIPDDPGTGASRRVGRARRGDHGVLPQHLPHVSVAPRVVVRRFASFWVVTRRFFFF